MCKLKIRAGLQEDIMELQELFTNTIMTTCAPDYNMEQRTVWSSSIENKDRWDAISKQFIVVGELNGIIVGFASSDKDYFDTLFVHKNYQRMGIAKKLYDVVAKNIKESGYKILTVHASKTARPFFEAMECTLVREQNLSIKGVMITNYIMEKHLS